LSVAASNSDTSMTITSDTNFAAKSGQGMVLIDESQSTEEIAYSASKTGAVLSTPLVNRGLEGGSAQGHAINATVKGILTAGMWNDLIDSLLNVLDQTAGTVKSGMVLTLPQINDTTADHQYVFAVSELTSDRTVTLPLLTGNDTFVFAAHTQTLQNKSFGDGTDSTKDLTFALNGATTAKTMTITSSHTDDRTLTLPDATDTVVGRATTDTLTNKRITKRVSTEASSATPTINTDNVDMHTITALATDITSFTTNLSGTPTNGQTLIIRIQDSGSGQTIAWGSSFESAGGTLPTTITAGKKAYVGLIYNSADSKWDCVAAVEEA